MENETKHVKKSNFTGILVALVLIAGVVALIVFSGNSTSAPTGDVVLEPVSGSTFYDTGDGVLVDNQGRPYVILFSTTTCPHCIWIKDTFDSLENEEFADKINLQHWELDTKDNTLTSEIETEVPAEMMNLFNRYGSNSVPAFVFGGKYTRVGNGYEQEDDLDAELEDFKLIINKLLEEN